MSCKVLSLTRFERDAKRLVKKYVSLKRELENLSTKLAEEPVCGVPLGNDVFKIRLAIASKGKGKSGGARVITYVRVDAETILLLSIYDKGEKATISDGELQDLMREAKKLLANQS
jgi:hypothetical protein